MSDFDEDDRKQAFKNLKKEEPILKKVANKTSDNKTRH